jgi:hypothetical protein
MTNEFNREEQRLRALLTEDFGDEADRFLPIVRELSHLPELPATDEEIMQATIKLRGWLPKPPTTRQIWRDLWFPMTLLRAELQLLRYELWVASILVIAIGLLVTSLTNETAQISLPFVQIAPVMAALGVAFIFNLNSEPPSEIILTCLISIRMILLARLTIIYCINLLLGVAGSVFIVVTNSNLSLWPLIAAWLVPMTLLSALAFFLGIVAKDPLFGSVVSLVLWIWQRVDIPYLKPPVTITTMNHFVLLVSAGLLCAAAVWLAGKDERWIGATQ